ncbi:MAG: P-type conjugative transfer protein TrbL, partial [Alphaproteobacteria bacterium]|nr:P-type conjugative transfer protein TrbL [Alphaproteobacteria bacterium]
MNDLGIIDMLMTTFSQYIDSGFGLLSGDVAYLSKILIGIDVTLAGLFWAMGGDGDGVLSRLIRKVLYVGAFAFILNNFKRLSDIIFQSFSGLGIKASGTSLSAAALLKPGVIAATGYQAAHPLLDEVSRLVGFPEIFSNALTVFVLLIAWLLVVIAFFILAIQLFISVLEFKLTTLAGFVLVPFALWNKTSFLAEKVLGNVISSGIKMMVLAVIVGIGSTLFQTFANNLQGTDVTLAVAMSQVLGALSLLGLGIFGPGIAAGLISGAPQLGAGAALGTAGAAAGAVALTGVAALGAVGAVRAAGGGGLAAIRAATAMKSATSTSYQLAQATSGETGAARVAAGLGGVVRAGTGAVMQSVRGLKDQATSSLSESASAGRGMAWTATGGKPIGSMNPSASSS